MGLILASMSPQRLQLLAQVGVHPDCTWAANLSEAANPAEIPRRYAARMAQEKSRACYEALRAGDLSGLLPNDPPSDAEYAILAADTVVAVGRRILPKTDNLQEATACLNLLSGRGHRVFGGICYVSATGQERTRLVESRVRFKHLSAQEKQAYLASGEWQGKAGGYAIQGLAARFVERIIGSYPNIVGLPLVEVMNLLHADGLDPFGQKG